MNARDAADLLVDTQRFDPARRCDALRQSWGCAPADRVLVYVGRLAPEKNLELLLRCHAHMTAVAPTLRLVVRLAAQYRACAPAPLVSAHGVAPSAAHSGTASMPGASV